MSCYRITVSYDGTDFEGWQVQTGRGQPAAPRTVQGTLEAAVSRLAGGDLVPVVGAGRTDAGVHAMGQTASFILAREMAAPALARALNGILPFDVRVLAAAVVPPDFHARKSALSKLYRYELDLGPVRLPTRRRFAGYHRGPLDLERMLSAAALYPGRRDFAALASTGSSVKTTVRTVLRSDLRLLSHPSAGDPYQTLVYEVEADGFLRKMVRSMVGGLLAAGTGTMSLRELQQALAAGVRAGWPPPAEACGLTLVEVRYP